MEGINECIACFLPLMLKSARETLIKNSSTSTFLSGFNLMTAEDILGGGWKFSRPA